MLRSLTILFSCLFFVASAVIVFLSRPQTPDQLIDLSAKESGYYLVFHPHEDQLSQQLSMTSITHLHNNTYVSGPYQNRREALEEMGRNSNKISEVSLIHKDKQER